MATIQFLGGVGTVTGSKYLVSTDAARVLVDCGLFQGGRELKAQNWQPLPVAPRDLDAVVLTHAHLDHTGYLPRLVLDGFKGRAHCTPGTADLLGILLPDAGFLQEEEAEHANRKGWSRHAPAKPLFTLLEAQRSLRSLKVTRFGEPREVAPGITITFVPAGHILGAAHVVMAVEEHGKRTTIVFSGDVGRYGAPLLRDPSPIRQADYLIVESTYGDRLHPAHPRDAFARVVRESAKRGGMLVIPSFAVGRTQELLYTLRELEDAGAVPVLDVFVDSPMAINANAITLDHDEEFDDETLALLRAGVKPMTPHRLHLVRDTEASRAINRIAGPGIILSASGMATGGRIKHHLKNRLDDPRNTVCFVGFQAAGTKGRAILEGASEVFIFGERVPIRAHIERVDGFSAHGDQQELLRWTAGFEHAPKRTFVTHGEPEASQALAERLASERGWKVTVPAPNDVVTLQPGGAAAQHELKH